ncbi:hypothetical protein TCAL_14253 [Tigriopus californicus]|uniref:NodB homology domain-containing protein n=1 Tax=Tigriopus californicus TaxID=6832 RepID=A0A553NT68_TIGCA|nr:hypothetical protein TCAL_14253 [Tigriopus californicus]
MNVLAVFLAVATLAHAEDLSTTATSNQKYIYFTSDGGPNGGTPHVLDAALEADIKMTFFVNAENLDLSSWNPRLEHLNQKSIQRMVFEGHAMGDLSFNHMVHNSDEGQSNPINTYRNISDIDYFGAMNVRPLVRFFTGKKIERQQFGRVVITMSKLVRLPHTDHWRVNMTNGDVIKHNCHACTLPKASNDIAIEIADELYNRGRSVFGWDVEWQSNWGRGLSTTYQEFMEKVVKFKKGFLATKGGPNKLVVLTHDHGFINNREDAEQYVSFFKAAKAAGFEFRTLDTFHSD